MLRWRKHQGLLQRDAAARIGVREGTYVTWELGQRRPSIRHLPTIVRLLGYDPTVSETGGLDEVETARRRLGWSQRRTATFLNVDPGTLGRWSRGASAPRFLGEQIDRFLAVETAVDLDTHPPEGSANWTLGKHLRARREALGVSRRDLAATLNVCSNSVLNWERDRQIPEIQFWPAVIAFLGYDPLPAPANVVDRIEAQRRRLGWTYKQVAAFIGMGAHTLLNWKNSGEIRVLRRDAFDRLFALASSNVGGRGSPRHARATADGLNRGLADA